jgi:hypothetical protein
MGMVCVVLLASIDVDIPSGVGGYALGTVLAGLAAAFCAVGSVMQHQAVSDSDTGAGLGLRRLASRPGWLLGQSAIVVGTVLQVAALGLAPVAIVQPILAGGLVVALGLRAARDRRLPSGGEFLGAGCTAAGLAAFLIAARPAVGRADVLPGTVLVVVTVVVLLALVGLATRTSRSTAGAVTCGAIAGVALGVAAVLTSAALKVLGDRGVVAALTSAPLWAAIVTALAAQYASQQAFSRGALALSLPALTVVDPVAAVPAARLLLGERLVPGHASVWLPAAVIAAAGVALLARPRRDHGPVGQEPEPAGPAPNAR